VPIRILSAEGEALMGNTNLEQAVFVTLVRTAREKTCARLLIESIRTFGGALRDCPIWLFEADPQQASCADQEDSGVRICSLHVPDTIRHYAYADKVYASAQAELSVPPGIQSLIWIDPVFLITQPPLLFDLDQTCDAAVRPVHIKNVGLFPEEPLNGFWKKICGTVGIDDVQTTIETFVDAQRIRAYFNSHAFTVNPAKGLLRQWLESFEILVGDEGFQMNACQDKLHQIFLHSATLSALLVARLDPERIRILPPEYNYPYHLHQSIPPDRQVSTLNDLVCVAYDERSLDPDIMDDITIHDPLRSWLSAHVLQQK
jgi:hypothetical protein